ncbi:uncharacterized protein EI90DRAFT_2912545 [Cantharellus anzutake]|uniref:uncharacterized protein n=1 Tax=Cantharellus anzutake TaxID=1750568 RepID=UPI001902D351|nr:uncharacterized protein EI90DRAFT_2912545 [Cantharellus anzutake]KAF8335819.1 hypothetical protein EI90DRAFT_2912545 [Cantharellus anzutake]
MSATGKDTKSATTAQFISALIVGLITVAVFTVAWFLLRKRFRRVFQPRVDVTVPGKQPPDPLPDGVVSWWETILGTPDKAIIAANGLDAYFFVRFLKVFGLHLLGPFVFLSCAVLIPLAATSHGGLSGLNLLTFGNVSANQLDRHVGYYLVAIILVFWTLYLVYKELIHLDEERQAWLASETHTSRALARTRTVMVTNLPPRYLTKEGILGLVAATVTGPSSITDKDASPTGPPPAATTAPSSVQAIWFSRTNLKQIEKVYDERNAECERLEGAEASLLALAAKNERKGKSPRAKGQVVAYHDEGLEGDGRAVSDDVIDEYVKPSKRPKWRLGLLGLYGERRTLGSSTRWIKERNDELEALRAKAEQVKIGNTAWIRFSNQYEAHLFARLVKSAKGGDLSMRLIDSRIEVVPEDIVWNNTSMNAYDRKIRNIVSWSLTIGLIIIWAIPVAFVGIVSNIDTLCSTVSFLRWICKIPSAVLGILKGVLPPVLLTVLFIVLIIILRKLVNMQGIPQSSEIELKLFQRYWLFQVIHGFLIVTLSSGLVGALSNISKTVHQLPSLLAKNLPTASIFFLTFVLASTWAGAAKAYSQAIPTVMYLLRPILGGNTPRKFWLGETRLIAFQWSLTWPPISLLVCLCVVYSVIQPIMTVVTIVAFGLLYVAYKYLLIWCADQPESWETGGLFYLLALKTVFVALYIEEWFLTALFFLSYSQQKKTGKADLAGGILMVITIIITIAAKWWLFNRRFPRDYILYSRSSYLQDQTLSSTDLAPKEPTGQAEITAIPTTPLPLQQEDELDTTSGFHERAFDHPALWKKQPVVWIADDELGIGKLEVERIKSEGVDASCDFARLNREGKLSVERGPPDEVPAVNVRVVADVVVAAG